MTQLESVFDYIIIGAGSAGCVLANRLTQDPKTTLLLLEAGGPDKRQEIHIPAAWPKLLKSECDWAYFTEEQPRLAGRRPLLAARKDAWRLKLYERHDLHARQPRGLRPVERAWKHRVGASKTCSLISRGRQVTSETRARDPRARDPRARDPRAGRATAGPLNVADLRSVNPVSRAFVEACAEAGIPRNDDFNGERQEGAGFFSGDSKRRQAS